MANRRDAKDWARENLKGLWTTPMIPFKQDYALDEDGIRHNVERLLQVKAGGIGFGFSEPWVLSLEERKRALEVSVDAVAHRVPAYCHATDHSVAETINLAQRAKDVGADAVMIWTPYEWAKSQDMIVDYFEYIASKVDIGIFAYNTYHSGISMTPETVQRLAKIPNICALKDAVNDINHTIRCIDLAGKDLVVSQSNEQNLLLMTVHFGQQVMLGTTSVFLLQSPTYQPIYDYWKLARDGNVAEAYRKYEELSSGRDLWQSIYQVLRDKKAAVHPLAQIKYWMELVGMAAGPVRPPMHGINDQEKAELKARIQATGWLERLYPSQQAAE